MADRRRIVTRSERDPATVWSIEDLFASDEDWERALEGCRGVPGKVAAYRGRLGESAGVLLEYLRLMEETEAQLDSVFSYPSLRLDEDTADAAHQAMMGRLRAFTVELTSAGAFEGPELAAIPDGTLEEFYAKEPGLERYRRYLDRARRGREHILGQEGEDLLAGAGQVLRAPSGIFTAFTNADMRYADAVDSAGISHPVTNGSYTRLLASSDRELRRSAYMSMYGAFGSFQNAFAAMLDGEIQKNVFRARARHYASTLQSALEPSEIPESVYHNLIEAVHRNLDKMHRYISLRKRALGVEELRFYDISTPLVPEADRVIPFEEAKSWVLEAARVYGEEYSRVLESAFRDRWMDIYENRGKRAGAYSSSCRTHPFVLLNHNDNLASAFTLAHEMGHAMHSYLSTRNQPPLYSHYVLFVAEVASTCNEALLMQYLLGRTSDRRERARLINHFLEQFRGTLYRQTMFAEFELRVHTLAEAGEALTARRFCEIYRELNRLYYGPDIVVDDEISLEWARIPHFYRRFYVYQYATGFSAAIALSRRILTGGPEAVGDYLRFLSGGSSADPVSLLQIAGVDMSTPEPVESALALFGELIDEMETLL